MADCKQKVKTFVLETYRNLPEILSFKTRQGRLLLTFMLLAAILPTLIFHVTLRIKLSNWVGSEPKEKGQEVEVATDDEMNVITLPLIYIFLCLFLLFTSGLCTEL